ncbi:Stp1/IreP family PP2C-type Ser/Thr phosphatase [Paenibacillus sp. GSMTC-2017]|uniref:Stp1/IreP family PP2C-type Ser/Thr phosphatase n=1 Tax=Paenibacillus sp. GSMTC-2017 TaxID=2794350 RepID=UPI0018D6823D|nr:Stp1/IreP family PP2C-type Ser/Thr phosphatase [Paenibacillus sp. GSMTC-2017]MBH5316755.1 Stp1/IreP family PP2C-type Ser/Thr phosphatase [Paenibacillus sp. GSMTC-2017]
MLTASRSNIGRVRQVNEDQSWVGQLNNGVTLAIVADGMGGHQAGDVASLMAVNAFRTAFEQHTERTELSEQEGKMLIRQAISEANETIYAMASQNERYHNMGTTIVALLVNDDSAIIGHVGDSRAYKVTSEGISQLTTDHSLVNELLKSGQLTEEEALHHPRRNVLTRAIGTDRNVDIDVQSLDLLPDDILMLCSDGLTNMVSEQQLLETVLNDELELEAKADHLIQLALDAGGDDNITVVLMQEAAKVKREERSL